MDSGLFAAWQTLRHTPFFTAKDRNPDGERLKECQSPYNVEVASSRFETRQGCRVYVQPSNVPSPTASEDNRRLSFQSHRTNKVNLFKVFIPFGKGWKIEETPVYW